MLSRLRERLRGDSGLTLPELLITVVISGVIATSIGATIVVALNLMDQTSGSLGDSGNTTFSSAYFGTDVQEATTVAASGSASCGTGTLVVDFAGGDFGLPPVSPETVPAAYASYVSYVTETVTQSGQPDTLKLVRNACWTDSPPGTLPLAPNVQQVLASGLSTSAPPAVECFKQAAAADQVMDGANSVACGDPLALMSVMTVTPADSAPAFQLIGTRRVT